MTIMIQMVNGRFNEYSMNTLFKKNEKLGFQSILIGDFYYTQ